MDNGKGGPLLPHDRSGVVLHHPVRVPIHLHMDSPLDTRVAIGELGYRGARLQPCIPALVQLGETVLAGRSHDASGSYLPSVAFGQHNTIMASASTRIADF